MDIQETRSQGVRGPDLTADYSSPFSKGKGKAVPVQA